MGGRCECGLKCYINRTRTYRTMPKLLRWKRSSAFQAEFVVQYRADAKAI